jgi:predicted RNA-binding Zn ribbon-like protein
VPFAPDAEWALRAAVDLVNTATTPDTLTTPRELERWWLAHNYTGRHDRDTAELTALRALRPRLRALLTADRDTAAEQVNKVLAAGHALPQLVRHGNVDWHLHIVDPDDSLDHRVLMETAMAVIDLIRSHEPSRVAVCADATCDGLVLDLSRNRSRRFCSTRCANRNAASAYRARGRAAAGR